MKLTYFFLALLGFLLLAFILVAITEVSGNKDSSIAYGPKDKNLTPQNLLLTTTQDGYPDWLIPLEAIKAVCDNPWVVQRKISVSDYPIRVLMELGLSDCYPLAGENAILSHLWHQGSALASNLPAETRQRLYENKEIELFFNYDADFAALGLQPPQTADLSGFVVHDFNGDGTYNPGEPTIPGTTICLYRDPLEPICIKSAADGGFLFANILVGTWDFHLFSPPSGRLDEFRYLNQIIESNHYFPERTVNDHKISSRYLNWTKIIPIESGVQLLVNHDLSRNFLLMQEWATSFSNPNDMKFFKIQAFYDLDVRQGQTLIYSGEDGPTYDQHDGLDASCPKGTEIVSVAEGRVIAIFNNSTVVIQHNNQLLSIYGHGFPLVEVDSLVPRGYPVAVCDEKWTTSGPHLHFAVWQDNPWVPVVIYGIPVFADMVRSDQHWAANTHPLASDNFVYILQGGRGIWTEINHPHPPYVRFP